MNNHKTKICTAVVILLSLSMLSGCSIPSYDGFEFPSAVKSTLTPNTSESYYIQRNFEGVEPTKEKTVKTVSSADGLCVIEKKVSYYDVTLDYENGSYYDIGAAYAEAVLQLVPDYPSVIEGYLFENIESMMGEGTNYEMFTDRVNTLRSSLDKNYQDEMQGFADKISSGQHGFSPDGKMSVEESMIMHMVPDAVRPTACSVMTVNGNKTTSGHRLAARVLEWDPGKDNQLSRFHCVTHFRSNSHSFNSVGLLGMLDVLTAVNDDGVMTGELDVGAKFDFEKMYIAPFISEGRTCYSYDLRYIMENYTTAKDAANYLADRSKLYTYNANLFIADDKDAFCVEAVVSETEGKTIIRDSSTELHDGLEWNDPDSFCIVNSFAAKGNSDKITDIDSNLVRWIKYNNLFASAKEKLSTARFKELMTAEKIKDSELVSFRSSSVVHLAVADFDSHTVQAVFSGKDDPDDIEWIDLGKFF